MKISLIIIGIFLISQNITIAQEGNYQTKNESFIYWQPDTKIDFDDYQSKDVEECLKYKEMYGFTMVSTIDIHGVVDVPKKRGKFEKIYIAPVFCKNCSCILSEDSLLLELDMLLFDVAEFYSRMIRKELGEINTEMNADNTFSMFYITVRNKWVKEMRNYFGTILSQVFIEKKENAFGEWRQTIDELLVESVEYATKHEECHRLIVGKTIEKGYKEAKYLMGEMGSGSK